MIFYSFALFENNIPVFSSGEETVLITQARVFESLHWDQPKTMNTYRLHIDIPLTDDQTQSANISRQVAEFLLTMDIEGVELIQYRLSNDLDRGNKNYLDINENGHASNKKNQIVFD